MRGSHTRTVPGVAGGGDERAGPAVGRVGDRPQRIGRAVVEVGAVVPALAEPPEVVPCEVAEVFGAPGPLRRAARGAQRVAARTGSRPGPSASAKAAAARQALGPRGSSAFWRSSSAFCFSSSAWRTASARRFSISAASALARSRPRSRGRRADTAVQRRRRRKIRRLDEQQTLAAQLVSPSGAVPRCAPSASAPRSAAHASARRLPPISAASAPGPDRGSCWASHASCFLVEHRVADPGVGRRTARSPAPRSRRRSRRAGRPASECRRAHFTPRPHADSGRALIGSPLRNRRRSSASAAASAYRFAGCLLQALPGRWFSRSRGTSCGGAALGGTEVVVQTPGRTVVERGLARGTAGASGEQAFVEDRAAARTSAAEANVDVSCPLQPVPGPCNWACPSPPRCGCRPRRRRASRPAASPGRSRSPSARKWAVERGPRAVKRNGPPCSSRRCPLPAAHCPRPGGCCPASDRGGRSRRRGRTASCACPAPRSVPRRGRSPTARR